jgi:predicted DNA-binding protein
MVTTIQIPIELKKELDMLKKDRKITYAQLLKELIIKEKKQQEQLLLKEYAIKYGGKSNEEILEWQNTEKTWNY